MAIWGFFTQKRNGFTPSVITDSYEIIFVLAGNFKIAEQGEVYHLKPDDALILTPEILHYGAHATNSDVKFYWAHFYAENFEKLGLKKHYSNLPAQNAYLFRELMNAQFDEQNKTLADLKLAEILISLPHSKADDNLKFLSEIKEYVRVNSDKPQKVSSVCEHFGYNADYLSKTFAKNTGVSLREFIITERVRAVKTYLLNTNLSIKEISAALGFENENLMVKFFKYNAKITPSQYRNTHNALHMNKK